MTASIAAIQASNSASRDNTSVLHPAVLATLQRLERALPHASKAARQQLQQAWSVQERTAWPEIAWSWSLLTNTGMPVEFAWSSRETAVRWTADVAPPEVPDAERLAATADLLHWPQGDALTAAHLAPWRQSQAGHKLRFGAWLGKRHCIQSVEMSSPETIVQTDSKLYVELPAGCALPPDCANRVWRGQRVQ